MDIAYGIEVLPENDPYIKAAEKAVVIIGIAVKAGAFFVDAFPVLKYIPSWVPGAGFQKFARESRTLVDEVVESPFRALKQAVVG
jgi:hypothetical protein